MRANRHSTRYDCLSLQTTCDMEMEDTMYIIVRVLRGDKAPLGDVMTDIRANNDACLRRCVVNTPAPSLVFSLTSTTPAQGLCRSSIHPGSTGLDGCAVGWTSGNRAVSRNGSAGAGI